MKKIILIAGGALLFSAINIGGSVFLNRMLAPPMAAATAVAAEPLPVEVFYHNVQPEFVVNFPGNAKTQFLMIEMVVATHDQEVIAILKEHDPELRNSLLMMLAEEKSEPLKTAEGKQLLREKALAKIDEMVGTHYKSDVIKDVFITRLVMQ
ncbi:flagellar basal body-associated FliL family protein [Granulosicoccus sp.]|jgi:flagellar FliL protein|nr:flagellar basal body-associated FliL family protein [Granulosicoccus sp.]MDB4224379.1 flagellar basal body-associated FliL family protein [Granulosicoccus sp.]